MRSGELCRATTVNNSDVCVIWKANEITFTFTIILVTTVIVIGSAYHLDERRTRSAGKKFPPTTLRMSPTTTSVHCSNCQLPFRNTDTNTTQHIYIYLHIRLTACALQILSHEMYMYSSSDNDSQQMPGDSHRRCQDPRCGGVYSIAAPNGNELSFSHRSQYTSYLPNSPPTPSCPISSHPPGGALKRLWIFGPDGTIWIGRVSYLIYISMRHYVLTTSGDIVVCLHTAVCLSC